MKIVNGRVDPDSKGEILDQLLLSAEESWGRELDDDEEAVLVHLLDPFAEYLAEQQGSLRDVLDAAQVEHATDQALDYLGGLVGVGRKSSEPSTTQIRFESDDPVTKSYTIPSGAGVQTDDADPLTFETDVTSSLPLLDTFDNGLDKYGGDLGSFTIQQSTVDSGDNALEATGSGTIITGETDISYGAHFHGSVYLTTDAIAEFIFGAQDGSNYYSLEIDASTDTVSLISVDDGTESTLNSTNQTLTTGEWISFDIQWAIDGENEVTVDGSTFTISDAAQTYTDGGFGIGSKSSNTFYIDTLTTSWVSVPATSVTEGSETTAGPDTLIILSTSISGIDSVTNPLSATGGRDREEDPDYRERIQTELSQGMRATGDAIYNALDQLPETRTVSLIVNDEDDADADGRPGHSFESICDVDADHYDEIAQTILDTKAFGDTPVGGYAGTKITRAASISNGQEFDINFSVPDEIQIYIDVTVDKTDEYAGTERLKSNIVQYIGGVISNGDNVDGELGVGDDVIYNKVVGQIMNTRGVADITSLDIATSDPPSGSSNISIAEYENASADATDSSIEVTENAA